MNREDYEIVKNDLYSMNWWDYDTNFKQPLLMMKSKYKITTEDMLDFEAFQKDDIENEVKGYLTDCEFCKGRGFMNVHTKINGKYYYQVTDCFCKHKEEE